ncbi:hypothetical protein ACFYXF_00255 [Streptomyces sp. NPDC002680]|uniref:hypothetical protein n=1 Tax=Streptomyces sp. NPDC002680 TaxID=3364659 RepID=UPI0036C19952
MEPDAPRVLSARIRPAFGVLGKMSGAAPLGLSVVGAVDNFMDRGAALRRPARGLVLVPGPSSGAPPPSRRA